MNRLDEVEQVGMVSHRQAWKQSAPGANAQVQILNATLDMCASATFHVQSNATEVRSTLNE